MNSPFTADRTYDSQFSSVISTGVPVGTVRRREGVIHGTRAVNVPSVGRVSRRKAQWKFRG